MFFWHWSFEFTVRNCKISKKYRIIGMDKLLYLKIFCMCLKIVVMGIFVSALVSSCKWGFQHVQVLFGIVENPDEWKLLGQADPIPFSPRSQDVIS